MMGIIIIGMIVGVLFINELRKQFGAEFSLAFVILMFLWDGVLLYTINPYATKYDMSIGIMVGTMAKCLLLLKYNDVRKRSNGE